MFTYEMIQQRAKQLEGDKYSLTHEQLIHAYIEFNELCISFYQEQLGEAQVVMDQLNGLIRRTTADNIKNVPRDTIDELVTGMIIDKAEMGATVTHCQKQICSCKEAIAKLKNQL